MERKRGIRRPRRRVKHHRPSTYIRHIDEVVKHGSRVVLWCRVSSGLQNANGNNDDQEAELRAAVGARGGTVVGVVPHEGRVVDADAGLYQAANLAAQTGAALLAESTSRFARHPHYHPKLRPHLTPTANALRDLRWLCGGVPLVTLHDPDATWQEERSHQSKRGQWRKGKRGGRPAKRIPGYKKRQRRMKLSKVFWLSKVGFSVRETAAMLDEYPNQIQRWRDKLRGR